jgi:hypothetical protein
MVGYDEHYLAAGIPLSKLSIQPPAEVVFSFEPFGGSGSKQYQLDIR